MLEPVIPGECNKSGGKRNANRVMREPSDRAFSTFRGGSGNVYVRKSPFGHVSEPTPDQANVGWRNLEGMFEKKPPKIKSERCAKPNEDCVNEEGGRIIQESPFY